MNRAEIKTRILRTINDNTTSPVLFSDDQLNSLVDEGLEVLAESARATRRTAMFARRPGTVYYSPQSIASDVMFPYRLWNAGTNRRFTAMSMQELDKYTARWPQRTGPGDVWFPVSWDLFGIWPGSPASSTGTSGGIVRMDYIAWPRELESDTDEPELPLASHDAIVLWGAYMGLLKKWDSENAVAIFKTLQEHGALADSRSGINKISHRINFSRDNSPQPGFPSDFKTRYP